ncbi:hypothetical protein VDGE_30364 [Verticillium dahliae]|uniref:Uncharacterized protein n=1 Tax=Verticillium dahliae TaxID=27337 RepID=A0A444RSN5_VERDA|nr:hypothetical protein VDGE_30364 [Verticillium dahliae]
MIDELGIRFIDSCCGTFRYLGEMVLVEASVIERSIAFRKMEKHNDLPETALDPRISRLGHAGVEQIAGHGTRLGPAAAV